MKVLICLFLSFTFLSACGGDKPAVSDLSAARSTGFASSPVVSSRTLALPSIESAEQYQAFSKESGGLVQNGRSVKFLIDLRKGEQNYFMNSNFTGRCTTAAGKDCSQYHYDFAREHLRISDSVETFNQTSYFTTNKRFAAGTVSTYTLDGRGEIYAVQLYPQDFATDENILAIATSVKKAMPIPGAKFVFVPTGNQQSVAKVIEKLKAL